MIRKPFYSKTPAKHALVNDQNNSNAGDIASEIWICYLYSFTANKLIFFLAGIQVMIKITKIDWFTASKTKWQP